MGIHNEDFMFSFFSFEGNKINWVCVFDIFSYFLTYYLDLYTMQEPSYLGGNNALLPIWFKWYNVLTQMITRV